MKLSDYRGEDAIELLADILEPAAVILQDRQIMNMIQTGGRKIDGVKYALKEYKAEIVEIMARLDGVEPKDYKCNIFTLPVKILDILNDKELTDFFTSQYLSEAAPAFGAATETTEDSAEK